MEKEEQKSTHVMTKYGETQMIVVAYIKLHT